MSRDILIIDGIVRILDRCATDVTYRPLTDPPDWNLICEDNWRALVGEPGEGETFRDREVAYIASIGLVEAKNEGE